MVYLNPWCVRWESEKGMKDMNDKKVRQCMIKIEGWMHWLHNNNGYACITHTSHIFIWQTSRQSLAGLEFYTYYPTLQSIPIFLSFKDRNKTIFKSFFQHPFLKRKTVISVLSIFQGLM